MKLDCILSLKATRTAFNFSPSFVSEAKEINIMMRICEIIHEIDHVNELNEHDIRFLLADI